MSEELPDHLRKAAAYLETVPELEPPPFSEVQQRPFVPGPLLPEGISAATPIVTTDKSFAAKSTRFSLADRTDMLWFHLGFVYEQANVPSDILLQFCADNKLDRKLVEDIATVRPVCRGTEDHNYVIQGVPAAWEDTFTGWIVNLLFTRKQHRQWWRVQRRKMPIIDPTATAIVSDKQIVPVHFLLPYGSRGITLMLANADGIPTLLFAPGVRPPEGTEPLDAVWS